MYVFLFLQILTVVFLPFAGPLFTLFLAAAPFEPRGRRSSAAPAWPAAPAENNRAVEFSKDTRYMSQKYK